MCLYRNTFIIYLKCGKDFVSEYIFYVYLKESSFMYEVRILQDH